MLRRISQRHVILKVEVLREWIEIVEALISGAEVVILGLLPWGVVGLVRSRCGVDGPRIHLHTGLNLLGASHNLQCIEAVGPQHAHVEKVLRGGLRATVVRYCLHKLGLSVQRVGKGFS